MKNLFLFWCTLLSALSISISSVEGQVNLVSNGNFETVLQTPLLNQLTTNPDLSKDWASNHGSPDLYHFSLHPTNQPPTPSCPTYINGSPTPIPIPDHSNGSAYMGLRCHYDSGPAQEQIVQQLPTPLTANKAYYAEFYAYLSPNSYRAVKRLGMGIGTSRWAFPSTWSPLPPLPEYYIVNSIPLPAQTGWQQISGAFLATSNARYVTIGSFEPHTDPQGQPTYQNGPGFSTGGVSCFPSDVDYHVIDDVGIK
ncbi:hypothetical protein EJV47_19375 [Hymenobacter gummosus]|uniref:DUF946 domain-containing protein n=1 Tax=Hymenobacter gummosus TaxID=1776032 RepID=A0A431TZB8_9BACT|nr:hypothetical protein [Hymenobacter gummosus]RTQ47578.1 hypothetical protein EJV47_19375 [Hymenobacter gummosus]